MEKGPKIALLSPALIVIVQAVCILAIVTLLEQLGGK
jgi:hypothetical protein